MWHCVIRINKIVRISWCCFGCSRSQEQKTVRWPLAELSYVYSCKILYSNISEYLKRNFHLKRSLERMIAGKLGLNPKRRPIEAWLELHSTPKTHLQRTGLITSLCSGKEPALVDRTRGTFGKSSLEKEIRAYFYFYFFECRLKDTLTAKNSVVSSWRPQGRPETLIYTPKRGDEHPRPFHMGGVSPGILDH